MARSSLFHFNMPPNVALQAIQWILVNKAVPAFDNPQSAYA
ncbi:MAG TPA: hypothetical protein VKA04_12180 [Pseudodesulfovibrio sp.]|nr:hypothetical protein [Pseudodesulfovibrio sp.]